MTDRSMDRMGSAAILLIKRSIIISTIINLDGNGDWDDTCKKTLKSCSHVLTPKFGLLKFWHCVNGWRTEWVPDPFCPSKSPSSLTQFRYVWTRLKCVLITLPTFILRTWHDILSPHFDFFCGTNSQIHRDMICTDKYGEQCLWSFQYFVWVDLCCRSHLPVEILYLYC